MEEVLVMLVVMKMDTTISRSSTTTTIRRATEVMVVTMEVMTSKIFVQVILAQRKNIEEFLKT
jgi:hypothetical protein